MLERIIKLNANISGNYEAMRDMAFTRSAHLIRNQPLNVIIFPFMDIIAERRM